MRRLGGDNLIYGRGGDLPWERGGSVKLPRPIGAGTVDDGRSVNESVDTIFTTVRFVSVCTA